MLRLILHEQFDNLPPAPMHLTLCNPGSCTLRSDAVQDMWRGSWANAEETYLQHGGANDATTLTLAAPWRVVPDATSECCAKRFFVESIPLTLLVNGSRLSDTSVAPPVLRADARETERPLVGR